MKIINKEILITIVPVSLHKQTYSDGTNFYILKDSKGNWKQEHGSITIKELIEQLEWEVKNELIQWKVEMINQLNRICST